MDKRSVADAAGLKQGDILIKMNSETINGKSQTLKVKNYSIHPYYSQKHNTGQFKGTLIFPW